MWQTLANLTSVQACESPLCSISETAVVAELVSWELGQVRTHHFYFPESWSRWTGPSHLHFPKPGGGSENGSGSGVEERAGGLNYLQTLKIYFLAAALPGVLCLLKYTQVN